MTKMMKRLGLDLDLRANDLWPNLGLACMTLPRSDLFPSPVRTGSPELSKGFPRLDLKGYKSLHTFSNTVPG